MNSQDPSIKDLKVGIIIPASMQISGSTSGVIRQAISYRNALLDNKIDCQMINIYTGVYEYSHLLIFQHTPEIELLIRRIKFKNSKAKIIYLPIHDPERKTSIIKKLFYRLPFEKARLIFSPRSLRIGCDKSDSVWVRSNWEKKAILNTGTKTPIHVIPLIIPIKIDQSLEGLKKDIDFLFVGHIDDPRKNVINLIKAVSELKKTITLVGRISKNKLKYLKKLSSELDVSIDYLGHVNDKSLSEIYARTKVLCLPSHYEGVGLVAMEAITYGAKLSITSIGGTKYYFKEKADFIQFPKIVADIKKTLSHSYEKSIDYAKIDFEFFKIYSSSRIAKMIIDTLNS